VKLSTWNVKVAVFHTDSVHSELFGYKLDGILSWTDFTDITLLSLT